MTLYNYTFLQEETGETDLYLEGHRLIWSVNAVPESPRPAYETEDYGQMLQALLPFGAAWPRDYRALLQQVLASLASEFGRVDARSHTLVVESDPRSASELLDDWERICGLPDQCVVNSDLTDQERRAAIEARLTTVGGQSKAFFIEYAYRLGYHITIDEFFGEIGQEHTWRINASSEAMREFKVGESTVGEALRTWGDDPLECAMNKLKPAHTVLLFGYE